MSFICSWLQVHGPKLQCGIDLNIDFMSLVLFEGVFFWNNPLYGHVSFTNAFRVQ